MNIILNNIFVLITLVLAIVVVVALIGKLTQNKRAKSKHPKISLNIKPKRLMTEREKAMFRVLVRIPNVYIFSQVSLGAILNTPDWNTRVKFMSKIADYVVTDSDFNILAVIELDDKSHDNKKEQDRFRDAMVAKAGYNVLRYPNIPRLDEIMQDLGMR